MLNQFTEKNCAAPLRLEGGLALGGFANVLLQDQPHPEPGERCAPVVEEHGDRLRWRHASLFQQAAQQLRLRGPERTDPFFATLAAQEQAGRTGQSQIARLERDDLTDTGTSIEHEVQQREVPAAVPAGAVNDAQHGLDFSEVQMLDFPRASAFEGHAQDPLGMFQVLGMLGAQIAEEAVDGAQAHVARAGPIAPARFQVLQEGEGAFDRELLDGELRGVTAFASDEAQQQLEAVTIAVERVRAQGSLFGQVVGEEAVQGATQSRGMQAAHATPPVVSRFPKRCWNRSLAAARNSGVSRRKSV